MYIFSAEKSDVQSCSSFSFAIAAAISSFDCSGLSADMMKYRVERSV